MARGAQGPRIGGPIVVEMSKAELRIAEDAADELGMTLSEWVRDIIVRKLGLPIHLDGEPNN